MQEQRSTYASRFFRRNRLSALPQSLKLYVTAFLCIAGFCYLSLLGSIWIDTEMRLSLVTEGYGDMGNIELVQHSLKYLFWFFGIFAFTIFVFLFTSYSEKLKSLFSVLLPALIILDISSSWFVRHHALFSIVMIVSGFFLAASFLTLFILIQRDLWFCQQSQGS